MRTTVRGFISLFHAGRFQAGFQFLIFLGLMAGLPAPLPAAELARLTADNWDTYAPAGKEVDAIYGDFLLRNEHVVVVVANPIEGRAANMTVRQVGGAIIDLTEREAPNDQLSAFYPGARRYKFQLSSSSLAAGQDEARGRSVELVVVSPTSGHQPNTPEVLITYSLRDGEPFVRVRASYRNPSNQAITVRLVDDLRADRTFEFAPDDTRKLYWVFDRWFGQAYGFYAEDHDIQSQSRGGRQRTLSYLQDGEDRFRIEAGAEHTLRLRLFPKKNLLEVNSQALAFEGESLSPVALSVTEGRRRPVAGAELTLTRNGAAFGSGRTGSDGRLRLSLPRGTYSGWVKALGRGSQAVFFNVEGGRRVRTSVGLSVAPRVTAHITDENGGPIACKVEFIGTEGTESPFFGPDSGEHAVHNLFYSHNGRFTQVVPPGTYRVIISHGPEYDAVFTRLEVPEGGEVSLQATLRRVVQTPGWVSADFHSHSSPSGDNTSSQLGRVLNLVAEHIEYAPCTEHGRLATYVPHLKRLGIEGLMGTAVGIELSRSPGTRNHQNAFPLILKPHTQDGGAPRTAEDPLVQIERLALWDDASDKLVQQNHPDIGHIFFDRNGNGQVDEGFPGMISFMDVIEVHPIERILSRGATYEARGRIQNHRIFNWLQLLNQGYRIPGVVNTDAHYNFHGSGWLRNYIKSKTDDPAQIETLDIVHASERGNVVMTNGPFLEVYTPTGGRGTGSRFTAGDTVSAVEGKVALQVRVQCPNWLDIDRVQVLVNGRPDPKLNFTRAANPSSFSDGVVKFDRTIPVELASDTHLIVVAIGENFTLGPVMGPQRGQAAPAAMSNPIFVDVDGNGFQPNGDTLDAPLPVMGGRPVP